MSSTIQITYYCMASISTLLSLGISLLIYMLSHKIANIYPQNSLEKFALSLLGIVAININYALKLTSINANCASFLYIGEFLNSVPILFQINQLNQNLIGTNEVVMPFKKCLRPQDEGYWNRWFLIIMISFVTLWICEECSTIQMQYMRQSISLDYNIAHSILTFWVLILNTLHLIATLKFRKCSKAMMLQLAVLQFLLAVAVVIGLTMDDIWSIVINWLYFANKDINKWQNQRYEKAIFFDTIAIIQVILSIFIAQQINNVAKQMQELMDSDVVAQNGQYT